MKKRWIWPMIVVTMVMVLTTGCGKKNPYGLSEKKPITITVWHYYSGVQKEEFDKLVETFNETEGRDQGIVVAAYNKGNIDELSQAVMDSIDKKIGSEPLPDVFAAYADKVYEVDQKGMAADISNYVTKEELAEYVDAYIEEGRFSDDDTLKVFPVAKSTEVLAINKTDWDRFAQATGEQDTSFSTWEGISEVAKSYYEWTDSLTQEPDDGKAFFGRDAFANYMIIGSLQLGHEITRVKDGKVTLDFDETVMRKLWDNYYVPYVNGYYASYGKFRSDDVKTGKLVAFAGSTSGISYFPSTVTLEDGTSYEIESKVYPLPNFAGTAPCAVQQGAGMMILKSEEKREYASSVFLKWFTNVDNNIKFSLASGYLPVKKEAGSRKHLEEALSRTGSNSIASENLLIGIDTANMYRLYTSKPVQGGDEVRSILSKSMLEQARTDRKKVEELMSEGVSREEAISSFVTDESFESWFKDTKEQLEGIIGE